MKKKLRFAFGKNWCDFLAHLSDTQIIEAENSLLTMLKCKDLNGKTLLDAGSGSGLFSLAAKRLGAASIHSFDYDQDSVDCTLELKRRYYADDETWKIERGDVLDNSYLHTLGCFDIVYSWGVLHHTGDMWQAIRNIIGLTNPEGLLALSLYNDQGYGSTIWKQIKHLYNILPQFLRPLVIFPSFGCLWGPTLLRDTIQGTPMRKWRTYYKNRGMSPWFDLVDWVGGYPFEVARRKQVIDFFKQYGFSLLNIKSAGSGLGCNEFVFQKIETIPQYFYEIMHINK